MSWRLFCLWGWGPDVVVCECLVRSGCFGDEDCWDGENGDFRCWMQDKETCTLWFRTRCRELLEEASVSEGVARMRILAKHTEGLGDS